MSSEFLTKVCHESSFCFSSPLFSCYTCSVSLYSALPTEVKEILSVDDDITLEHIRQRHLSGYKVLDSG